MRNAAGELDHFEAALDVALGVGEGLAVLGREKPRQLVEFLLHQIEEFHQHARAPLRIGGGPGRLRRFGDRDGVLDLGVFGQRHLGLHLAGIGVEDVAEASRSPLHLFAADEVADLTHVVSPWTLSGIAAALVGLLCRFLHAGHGALFLNQGSHRLDRHRHDAGQAANARTQ